MPLPGSSGRRFGAAANCAPSVNIMRFVSVSDSDPLDARAIWCLLEKYDKFSKGDAAEHKRRKG